jgi:TrmH family RNA methyltransferase
MPLRITSVQNPRVKAAVRLRDRQGREEQRRILIDGRREIRQALAAGVPMLEAFYSPEALADEQAAGLLAELRAAGAELIEVAPHVQEKLAFGQRLEPVVAVAQPQPRQIDELALPPDALVAVVEGVEKPGNLGAIVRTADAAGVAAVLVADGPARLCRHH